METILNNFSKQLIYDPKNPILFNTGFFLWWFLILLSIYLLIHKKQTLKIVYLLTFSLYFYYKSSGFFFVLIIFSTCVDFFVGLGMYKAQTKAKKTFLLVLSLIANLGLLGYFKYTNFFIGLVNSIANAEIQFQDIFLPVGISFYTFQTLSYTIDIYRGKLKPINNILDFGFFVSFFPQLVAGPIVRAKDFLPQIHKPLIITKNELGKAVFLIASGLFKKAVISDYISVNFVDRIFDNPMLYSGFENLMGVYGYALQIYCDFSGYSDMAIGLALLLGFRLPVNFNAPYNAASITEFWRRWHITLSSWLKDYLYIPLGGNRKGSFGSYFFIAIFFGFMIAVSWINGYAGFTAVSITLAALIIVMLILRFSIYNYLNLMVTMLLGGLWHGASWKFIIWGGLHGIYLAVEKIISNFINIPKNNFTKPIGIIVTFHLVCLSWVLFRATSYQNALDVLHQIFNEFHWKIAWEVLIAYKEIFLLFLIGYALHFKPKKMEINAEKLVTNLPLLGKSLLIVFVIWLVIQTKSSGIQPFIYFQF